MFEGFEKAVADVNGQKIAYVTGGEGAPLLMLHGFPQTHAMWAEIAPKLAEGRRVICADLRGYGASSKPKGTENYSFREMGADMTALMTYLGHDHFDLVGHDRGARTAHRITLDHEDRINSLTLMDIVPTQEILDTLRSDVARAYYHWFFLTQPYPFPETMIGHDADFYFETCLAGWGDDGLSGFAAEQLDAYRAAWRDPDCIRAMCDDYRAAIEHDLLLDRADLRRKLNCPTLILWGSNGLMDKAYDMSQIWADRLTNMEAQPITGGHFFPDTTPGETIAAIEQFLEKWRG